jgi:hypothetical protein
MSAAKMTMIGIATLPVVNDGLWWVQRFMVRPRLSGSFNDRRSTAPLRCQALARSLPAYRCGPDSAMSRSARNTLL